jgi:hypothetical protein
MGNVGPAIADFIGQTLTASRTAPDFVCRSQSEIKDGSDQDEPDQPTGDLFNRLIRKMFQKHLALDP